MKKSLSRDAIKYIAVFAMLLDHIAWTFLPFGTAVSQVFHSFGRITAPVMCFFISEGYVYTKSKKKYMLRLFVFALISQIPWYLMRGEFFTLSFSMMFTLFLSLLAVHIFATADNKTEKVIYIAFFCLLSLFCDWLFFAPLWCVCFYKYRENEKMKYLSFSVIGLMYFLFTLASNVSVESITFQNALLSSLYTLGVFLSIPLLMSYNGKKGKYKASKWIFYFFYPLHMAVLGLIKMFI